VSQSSNKDPKDDRPDLYQQVYAGLARNTAGPVGFTPEEVAQVQQVAERTIETGIDPFELTPGCIAWRHLSKTVQDSIEAVPDPPCLEGNPFFDRYPLVGCQSRIVVVKNVSAGVDIRTFDKGKPLTCCYYANAANEYTPTFNTNGEWEAHGVRLNAGANNPFAVPLTDISPGGTGQVLFPPLLGLVWIDVTAGGVEEGVASVGKLITMYIGGFYDHWELVTTTNQGPIGRICSTVTVGGVTSALTLFGVDPVQSAI